MADSRVVVKNLSKTYHTRRGDVRALDDVSIEIGAGEILVLLGPSGCGKTTLLRCVAGLEHPDTGEIQVNGKTVEKPSAGIALPPEARHLSMVFQSYALWPHMTVFENVAYPLRSARLKEPEVEERAKGVLNVVGLESYRSAYPGQLSGGQQQRVALARALVANEGVVLFDEPLSNLDAKVRERLRLELLSLQREIGFSALYVTHDQAEATILGDRIAVMDVGTVAQIGSPMDVYNRPSSRYVAQFVGSANELTGTVESVEGGSYVVSTAAGNLRATGSDTNVQTGQPVVVVFRPEHCRLANGTAPAGDTNRLACEVQRSLFLGTHVEHVLTAAGQQLLARSFAAELLEPGHQVSIDLDPSAIRVFGADS